MEELNSIKNIIDLSSRLQNLCEGFDETNKTALITTKLKILLEVSKQPTLSPSILKTKVGLAKSNLAIVCNSLINDGLIAKTKDKFDTRSIFYSLTANGEEYMNSVLSKMKKNFESELAYKNNFKQIDTSVGELFELVK